MSTKENLMYLSKRLGQIVGAECTQAFGVVSNAMDDVEQIDCNLDAAHDIYQKVWDHVSRALDHGEAEGHDLVVLEAIEAEMAGHVLNIRVKKGLLVERVQPEPAQPPRLNAFWTFFTGRRPAAAN